MTPDWLKQMRKKLGLNKAQMALQLETPYPTYRDWEAGLNRIPGVCKVAVEGLLHRDQKVMDQIKNGFRKNSDTICQNAP